ncbi:hypothetical protein H2259_06505 [Campylobacter sp. RM10532]|uniref:Uncharacterized protein n=1 Tax=Campylobacter molothri TaxID=1032242 RepID=A0ACC5W340_9BACT|nr:hypothetical protein [Campylobacter sp. RM13744]MBZ7945688.1 hypothetical protein [Campylobacter sp. RM10532]MBZ7958912.1 hypothetical protein [Campylobacter sp. RM9760]MBZ7960304.1 hypothetical protein [Campylobacter sp. RM12397]MBZ7969271.1 hypothetical protein [Campylobacter sp. RM9759]MBZ7970661.1 hypothetical protein [Campylobacter sp. RM3125]MBZ7972183.1 hypothetical protein [Campylobacter sp. RM3124]MBZ7975116.1 hypothetical protein [Campylobacter sp. RM9754]
MKLLFVLFISLFLNSNLFASNLSQKKIIKLKPSEDNFELIDLGQNVINSNLDDQKAVFDSSSLIEKKPILVKDKDKDFAIVLSFRKNFGYLSDGVSVDAKEFSTLFSKRLINDLKLNFANSIANNLYQNSKILSRFSPKDAKMINVSPFLMHEKNKIYTKSIDYLIVINLDDFYVITTNYFITLTKDAVAKINFKIISLDNGKILKAKNVKLNFALDVKNLSKNYQNVIDEMPKMLSEVIDKEVKTLMH